MWERAGIRRRCPTCAWVTSTGTFLPPASSAQTQDDPLMPFLFLFEEKWLR